MNIAKASLAILCLCGIAQAQSQTWSEHFNSGTLDKWSYVLHPQGVEIALDPTNIDNSAALITVKGDSDYLWKGNPTLNRVELQKKPPSTTEGSLTKVQWQFMLPKLFSQNIHQIAYWESDKTYQQSIRLQLQHNILSLVSSQENEVLWSTDQIIPQQWYTIELSVLWSTTNGNIQLKIDHQTVVKATTSTLISNDQNMFFQLGILRQQNDSIEQIWLDSIKIFNH